jgi:phage terminase Nu1 subunit (DNA packaging protein)
MSEEKQLDPKAVCRLFVTSEPAVVDESAIREAFGGLELTSMDEVAQAMGVKAHTVRNSWRRDGMPGTAKRGTKRHNKFPLAEIIVWHLQRQQSASVARGRDEYTDRLRVAEVKRAEATAQLAEMRIEEASGQMVPIGLVRAEVAGWLTDFRDGVLDIPRHIKPMLPTKIASRVVSEVDRRLRLELTALSERKQTNFKNGANGHVNGEYTEEESG